MSGHATVLRRRIISGPRGPLLDVCTEHNTHQAAVFPSWLILTRMPRTQAEERLPGLAWTPWDRRQLFRAALATLVTLGLAWLVTGATDEGGVSWGERAGRTLPLTPLCATVGAWVALAPALARGEALALEALGRTRAQIAAGAVAGGAAMALLAAAGLGLAGVGVAGFFPTATHASAWTWTGAAFVDPLHGLRVGVDGAPVRVAAEAGRALGPIPAYGRATAAAVTAMAGLALPLLLARALLERSRALPLVVAAGLAVGASVLLFQAAAAGHVPAVLGGLPTLALLGFAVRRYRA
jgi:hypothetical protein